MELTILMPCLNEENTIGTCIQKAKRFIEENKIEAEILIIDNGSTDNSVKIAKELGARVMIEKNVGYGNALNTGNINAKGKYVIMGDSDDSYDFYDIMPILEKLRAGNELVVGNRFKGKIEKGAMPWSHKYIGNPFLSYICKKLYKIEIGDFHCGLRGYETEKINKINLKTSGMEYATEMILKANRNHLKICEVPIKLKKDGRNRKSHLRTLRDGIRHLKIIVTYLFNDKED